MSTGPEPGNNNGETHQHRIISFILMPRLRRYVIRAVRHEKAPGNQAECPECRDGEVEEFVRPRYARIRRRNT